MELIIAVFGILFTWALVIGILSGIGLLLLRLTGVNDQNIDSAFTAFWLGWSAVIVLLLFWHLVLPVNGWATLIVSLVGVIGLGVGAWRFVPAAFGRARAAGIPGAAFALGMLGFSAWIADFSVGHIQPYDAGLYHLIAIRWFEAFPVVPGLGNLHGRLAFNNSYYLFYGLLDVGPWWHRSEHLVGGLLVFVATAQLGIYGFRAIRNRSGAPRHELLGILLLIPLSSYFFIGVNNTSTDVPVFILGVLVAIRLFKLLFQDLRRKDIANDAIQIVIFSMVGITVKLSFVVFGGLASVLALWWLIRAPDGDPSQSRIHRLGWPSAAALLILLPWLVHGVMLSGYPLYPISVFSLDVPWRVPRPAADFDLQWIRAFARAPNQNPDTVMASWDWLLPWALKMLTRLQEVILPLVLALIGLTAWLYRERSDRSLLARGALLMVVPLTSLAYWFVSAPDVRFAGVAFWMLGAGALVLSVRPQSDKVYANAILALSGICMVLSLVLYSQEFGHIAYPGPDHGLWPIPAVTVHKFETSSGLTLYVPDVKDQCWDAPLPCTPFPNHALRLLESGNLASGFTVQATQ